MKRVLKNKRMVIALLVVTVGIWGGIVYRIVEYSNREPGLSPLREKVKVEISGKEDSLLMDYRDPFLGSLPHKPSASAGDIRRNRHTTELAAPPPFRFSGQIRKGKQNSLIIIIGGDIRLISAREKFIDGYRIDKIYADSLCVSRGKYRYTLRME